MDTKLDIALQALFNIRHVAVSNGNAPELLRRMGSIAVDACDAIEGKKTSIDDRPLTEWVPVSEKTDRKWDAERGAFIF